MNIKQAKEYIKNTVVLYLKKDEFGDYKVPVVRQRPIFMVGAPGIGKTAIMEQIAEELNIALVSYSMTHHTRQSALGLPFITKKKYGDSEVSVSEYTMSEIIATIYDTMEASGRREGILFLDEINCVSETLAPSMLQFLQYKIFGKHAVPEGWIVVTAGNPPEYNKSVREFDVVTYDRLKVLEVEPEFAIWKEYASEKHLHSAVINYLDIKKEHFYLSEMTTKGKSYVTARGWEDLSEILYLYEEEGLKVEDTLIAQYLRNDKVVREFSAYYDLYQKYKRDYRIEEILAGEISEDIVKRANGASFDERLSLLGMLSDRVMADMREAVEEVAYLTELQKCMVALKNSEPDTVTDVLEKLILGREKMISSAKSANALSDEDRRKNKKVIAFLDGLKKEIYTGQQAEGNIFEFISSSYSAELNGIKASANATSSRLHNVFAFIEKGFEEGNEMLIFVTELTANSFCARFLGMFASPDYKKYSEEMLLSERNIDLKNQIDALFE